MEELTGDLSKKEYQAAEITWEIPNFLDEPAAIDFCLKSPPFPFANAVWQLEVYPNGRNPGRIERYIDLRISRLTSSVYRHEFKADVVLKTSLVNDHERPFRFDHLVSDNEHPFSDKIFYFRRLELMASKGIFFSETLTVCFHMQIKSCSKKKSPESCSPQHQIGGVISPKELQGASAHTTLDTSTRTEVLPKIYPNVLKLQSDYKKLLESEEEADVCLKVSDKEFRAHKCILRARSTVFSAVFKHDTEEKASGEVVIEDLDPESFPDFLQHMYTGSLDTLSEENVFNLYTAADKYDVTDLKSDCKNYMERTLSVDTFCNVMIWALRYKEDELLKLAIDFFRKNLTKIIVTVKWQMFSKEYNTEANELLIKALVPNDKK